MKCDSVLKNELKYLFSAEESFEHYEKKNWKL